LFGCSGAVLGVFCCLMRVVGGIGVFVRNNFYMAVFVKIKSRRKPQGVQYIKGA
jgi:hypothetical protein